MSVCLWHKIYLSINIKRQTVFVIEALIFIYEWNVFVWSKNEEWQMQLPIIQPWSQISCPNGLLEVIAFSKTVL